MSIASLTSLLTVVLAVMGTSGNAQGPVVVRHSGYTDPLSEGFLRWGYGTTVVGPVTDDMGFDAWLTGILIGGVGYDRKLPDFAGADWTLSLTTRVVSPATPWQMFSASVANSSDLLILYFGSQPNGDQTVRVSGAFLTPVLTLEGGSSYHNYQIRFNARDRTAGLWVDGTERLTGIPPNSSGTRQYGDVFWGGSYQAPVDFQANWSLVSLEIPEPSAGCLLAAGGLLLMRWRRGPRSQR